MRALNYIFFLICLPAFINPVDHIGTGYLYAPINGLEDNIRLNVNTNSYDDFSAPTSPNGDDNGDFDKNNIKALPFENLYTVPWKYDKEFRLYHSDNWRGYFRTIYGDDICKWPEESQEQFFNNYCLYKYNYLGFLRQLKCFDRKIIEVQEDLEHNILFSYEVQKIPGFPWKAVKDEYNRVQQKLLDKEVNVAETKWETELKNTAIGHGGDDGDDDKNDFDFCGDTQDEYHLQRSEAIRKTLCNDEKFEKQYEIQNSSLLSSQEKNSFALCYGNHIQQQVHSELVCSTNDALVFWNASQIKDYSQSIVSWANFGVQLNNNNYIQEASLFSNACSSMVSFAKGAQKAGIDCCHEAFKSLNPVKKLYETGHQLGTLALKTASKIAWLAQNPQNDKEIAKYINTKGSELIDKLSNITTGQVLEASGYLVGGYIAGRFVIPIATRFVCTQALRVPFVQTAVSIIRLGQVYGMTKVQKAINFIDKNKNFVKNHLKATRNHPDFTTSLITSAMETEHNISQFQIQLIKNAHKLETDLEYAKRFKAYNLPVHFVPTHDQFKPAKSIAGDLVFVDVVANKWVPAANNFDIELSKTGQKTLGHLIQDTSATNSATAAQVNRISSSELIKNIDIQKDVNSHLVKPLGIANTGRTDSRTFHEQLAMEEVMSNPLKNATNLSKTKGLKMTDGRWPAKDGWVKMTKNIQNGDEKIEIHFLYNEITGQFDDFKFKDH